MKNPLRSIRISGLRCFGPSPEKLDLALPTGKPGSGLTTLVGPNSGGKSTVLQAIQAALRTDGSNLPASMAHQDADHAVSVKIEFTEGKGIELRSNHDSPDRLELIGRDLDRQSGPAYLVGSNRKLPRQAASESEAPPTRSQFLARQPSALPRQEDSGANPLSQRMRLWKRNGSRFPKIFEMVHGGRYSYATRGREASAVTPANYDHDVDGLGTGTSALYGIIDAIHDAEDGELILIDEPERSLHPSMQRKLAELLEEESARLQIVIATHSPLMVSWRTLRHGGTVARSFIDPGNHGRIAQLSRETSEVLCKFATSDLGNLHVLGSEATEAFFLSDHMVLVEGQQDAHCYRHLFRGEGMPGDFRVNGTVFGWGVGGSHNMGSFAQAMRELGFVRVCGVLDADMESLCRKLALEYPSFKFLCAPALDVRKAKTDKMGTEYDGLIDSDGQVRAVYREAMTILVQDLNQYLAGVIRQPVALIREVAREEGRQGSASQSSVSIKVLQFKNANGPGYLDSVFIPHAPPRNPAGATVRRGCVVYQAVLEVHNSSDREETIQWRSIEVSGKLVDSAKIYEEKLANAGGVQVGVWGADDAFLEGRGRVRLRARDIQRLCLVLVEENQEVPKEATVTGQLMFGDSSGREITCGVVFKRYT